MNDLRPCFFSGREWYEGLTPPASKTDPTAWYLAKMVEERPYIATLNAALAFAVEHDLTDEYRARFGGISPGDISPGHAKAEGRGVDFPIWEIANELLVARYLERVLDWRFAEHEPSGD